VVEDDAAMRHLLVEVLQEAGFLAGCAAGVEEALALLRLHDFDAVLSDVHMRDRSGFEILGELNARGKRTRVVLMTSFASPDVGSRNPSARNSCSRCSSRTPDAGGARGASPRKRRPDVATRPSPIDRFPGAGSCRGCGVMARQIANHEIADALERVADLLEAQHASPYRVRAYRGGAATVRAQEEPLVERVLQGGTPLEALRGIGKSLAAAIRELVHTGRLGLLERLEGQVSPEDLFTTVPGIGESLARRAHLDLDIETLEELELAAHDGRLRSVPGFGARRVRGVREALASMLARSTRRRARLAGAPAADAAMPPDVATLLAVDAEYRVLAARGELRTIAPRRFNPEGRAWLPILHVEREGWSLSALFSNTARAHELGRTRDWVVIYYERDGDEGQ
jgi:CheY-like chemotaxis protein